MEMDKENSDFNLNSDVLIYSPINSKSSHTVESKLLTSESVPTLICAKFQESLWLEFGSVSVKSANSLSFKLNNPSKSKSVRVSIEKIPLSSSLRLYLGNSEHEIEIGPTETKTGEVVWSPTENTSIRETLLLKLDSKALLQVIVHGVAGTGQKNVEKNRKRDSILRSSSTTDTAITTNRNSFSRRESISLTKDPIDSKSKSNKTKNIVLSTAASTTLSISTMNHKNTKQPKRKSVINNNEFKHVVFDDNWAEKQTKSFTNWMNMTFAESQNISLDTFENEDSTDNISDNIDTNGLRSFMQKRFEAKIRQKAVQLIRSEMISSTLYSISQEISEQRLVMRDDVDIHADIGLQETLHDMLFSYDCSWLKIGLETIFGEIIHFPNNKIINKDSKLKSVLKSFIHEKLFSDHHIVAKFNKQKLLYVAQEKKMKYLLRKHLLLKFLSLVLFLDKARNTNLIPSSTLFARNAAIKSSKEVIASFCRYFLRGEGDVIRHLGLIGYNVTFVQSYVDEYEYTITNLAVDLRDGVRLVRLFELLTNSNSCTNYKINFELSAQLRVPAVSRLQKLHNVGLVVNKLENNSSIEPKHIVDGNRDMTLLLLWKLLYFYQLNTLVSPARVMEEVTSIQSNEIWRRSIYDVTDNTSEFAVSVPIRTSEGVMFNNKLMSHSNNRVIKLQTPQTSQDVDGELSIALLQWCQAIAGQYDVPVYNLTNCLADGRVLCLLVHYYHPTILPTRLIKKTTSNLHDSNFLTHSMLDTYMDSDQHQMSSEDINKAISGERKNYLTLKRSCNSIGGIPFLLPPFDSKNIPEEKTMVVFLGYLFSRLIESSQQVNAAIKIQRLFRKILPIFRSFRKLLQQQIDLKMKRLVLNSKISDSDMPINIVLSKEQIAAVTLRRSIGAYLDRKRASMIIKAETIKVENEDDLVLLNLDLKKMVPATPRSVAKSRRCSFSNIYPSTDEQYFQEEQELQQSIRKSGRKSFGYDMRLDDLYATHDNFEFNEDELLQLNTSISQSQKLFDCDCEEESSIGDDLLQQMNDSVIMKIREESDTLRMDYELRLINEELARKKAEEDALKALEANKLLEEKLQAEELAHLRYFEQMKLEMEEKIVQELLSKQEEEQMIISAYEKQLADERRNATIVEKNLIALTDANALDAEALHSYEEKLKELENNRANDQIQLAEAEKSRLLLEQQLEFEKQAHLDELTRIAAENERLQLEFENKIKAEEVARVEKAAREELEARILAEAEARAALELKLKMIEDERIASENEKIRLEEEKIAYEKLRIVSLIKIQSTWRLYKAMTYKTITIKRIILLQTLFRARSQFKSFYKVKSAMIQLQSYYRSYKCRKMFVKMNKSIAIIGKAMISYHRNKIFALRHSSAIRIQSICLCYKYHKSWLTIRKQIIKVQSMTRSKLAFKKFVLLKKSIHIIQSSSKKFIARQRFHSSMMKLILASHKIKSLLICAVWKAKLVEMKKLKNLMSSLECHVMHKASVKVIHFMRLFVKKRILIKAVHKIERWFRSRLIIIRSKKLCKGFTQLIALRRAYLIRRRNNSKIVNALNRIKQANTLAAQNPTMRLSKRTANALQVLQDSIGSTGAVKMISQILKACQTLEYSTQISKHCCESFAHAGAYNILFGLLRSCNRSTPHQELLRISLVILLNVARHFHLASIVALADDATDALVDLIQMFRDKRSLFILACELLSRLVIASEHVKSQCNTSVYHKRIEGIHNILERKHRLEVRVRSTVGGKSATFNEQSTQSSTSEGVKSSNKEFQQYRGKAYETIEPITCIEHLIRLISI
eukprot:gene7565-10306_t